MSVLDNYTILYFPLNFVLDNNHSLSLLVTAAVRCIALAVSFFLSIEAIIQFTVGDSSGWLTAGKVVTCKIVILVTHVIAARVIIGACSNQYEINIIMEDELQHRPRRDICVLFWLGDY